MEQNNWLPLIEYSNKHNVSISTLRRRIKENSIHFHLQDGKYYILDDAIEKASKGRRPIQIRVTSESAVAQNSFSTQINANPQIIDELKKAYASTLQSKEELIFQLREEIADLKTLVKVLEEEVERTKLTTSSRY